MKGLLLKEWYVLWGYCKILFLTMVFLSALGALILQMQLYTLLLCGMFTGLAPMTLLGYEAKDNWRTYSGYLPVTREQLVSVKYILCASLAGFASMISLLVYGCMSIFVDGFTAGGALCVTVWILLMGLLPATVLLPVVFRWGIEIGQVVQVFCTAAMGGALSVLIAQQTRGDVLASPGIALLALLLGILLFGVSWMVSIALYRKREVM